jgi:hypothetical protein
MLPSQRATGSSTAKTFNCRTFNTAVLSDVTSYAHRGILILVCRSQLKPLSTYNSTNRVPESFVYSFGALTSRKVEYFTRLEIPAYCSGPAHHWQRRNTSSQDHVLNRGTQSHPMMFTSSIDMRYYPFLSCLPIPYEQKHQGSHLSTRLFAI